MRRMLRALLLLPFGVAGSSCTLLVHFVDVPEACEAGVCFDAGLRLDGAPDAEGTADVAPDDHEDGVDAGACLGKPDGSACGTDDPCNDAPTCAGGQCVHQPKADGTPCAPALDACHTVPACTKGVCGPSKPQPVGYNWLPGNDNARCCGDAGPVLTTTSSNCGVCGIVCGAGQTCGTIATHYLCLGCNGTNAACWSDCCSATSGDHCAPGDCAGACATPDKCAKFGAHCQVDVVDYCTY